MEGKPHNPQQTVQAMPKLHELADCPELAQQLPPEAIRLLYWQCLRALNALSRTFIGKWSQRWCAPKFNRDPS